MKKTKVQQPVKGKRKLVKIQSKAAYELTMKEINVLMKKREANLSAMEIKKLKALATAAETYEDTFQPLPMPESLPDIVLNYYNCASTRAMPLSY